MPVNKPIIGVAAAVIVAAAGVGYYLHAHREQLPIVPLTPVAPPAAEVEPPIAHPLPVAAEGGEPAAPLPALADSDATLLEALTQLAGEPAVKDFLRPESVVRHLVVTIDNLPRQKVAVEKRPTNAIAGSFTADGDELHATLDRQNYERYKPLVAVVRKLDMQKLAALYVHFYPLFQQSYQDLGYPTGYFNDRLVQVIDVMLAAPQPGGPVELVRPNVMYTFADPALEARPAGQKLLIRMGPENAAAVKAKLLELRAIVTAAPLKH
jgi:Protein of unknown function (DUF3014)